MKTFKKLKRNKKQDVELAKTAQVARPVDELSLSNALSKHRQTALKKGLRHRRPVKKARHSVMIFTLSLVAMFVVAYLLSSFYILQKRQSYSNLAYNISKTVPYNISSVDGEPVSYEEYLFILRQNLHYLIDFEGVGAEKINIKTEDGKRIVEVKKSEALTKAEEFAFVRKQARDLNLSVSDQEVDQSIKAILSQKEDFTEAELEKTLRAHYGWSLQDYKRYHKMVLLERKVLAQLDQESNKRIQEARAKITSGEDFLQVATPFAQQGNTDSYGGSLGVVNIKTNSANLSSSALYALKELPEGSVTDVLISNDSLMIIKNLRSVNEIEKEVQIISIKFKDAASYLDQQRTDGKIHRKINPKNDPPTNVQNTAQ